MKNEKYQKYDKMFLTTKTFIGGISHMNSITQNIKFKQSVIKYSYKHGVT